MTEFGQRAPPAATEIIGILNIPVNDSSWTEVAVPALVGNACKAVAAKLLTGNDWHVSGVANGATSVKLDGPLTLDVFANAGVVLFYAQTDSGDDTLQVLLLN